MRRGVVLLVSLLALFALTLPQVNAVRYSPCQNATINGTRFDDFLVGTSGRDVIRGGLGDDTIIGGGGGDVMCGNGGADVLLGGASVDFGFGGRSTFDRCDAEHLKSC